MKVETLSQARKNTTELADAAPKLYVNSALSITVELQGTDIRYASRKATYLVTISEAEMRTMLTKIEQRKTELGL